MNDNYKSCVEGCSLPSSPNDLKVLLTQIKREVKDLVETTEAKLLRHDGKIAEMCKYIKDNLSNSIRCLLDSMMLSGELDEIIIETITDIKDLVLPPANVKTYKAYGDGVHDDTLAIEKAIKDANTYKTSLVIPDGTYKISKDLDVRNIDVKATGNIIGSTLIIGGNATSGKEGQVIELRDVDSVKIIGLKNSTVTFKKIKNLYLYANGDIEKESSIAYNHFKGVVCENLTMFSEGEKIGWINENVLDIKRIDNISIDGNYDHNNNQFLHCNLEGATIEFKHARNNYFSARCEGDVETISSDESQSNFIEKEYYYRHYFGLDTKEKDGVYTYFKVNQIQDNEKLLKLDYGCKDYPEGIVTFNEDGTFNPVRYANIYHTHLVPIDRTFAIRVRSDKKVFRTQFNFFDENKNPITTAVNNVLNSNLMFGYYDDWLYSGSTNVDVDTTVLFPGEAKYMEMRVIFGDNVSDIDVNYLHIELLKMINSTIHIANKL